jgi:hypothetical protein
MDTSAESWNQLRSGLVGLDDIDLSGVAPAVVIDSGDDRIRREKVRHLFGRERFRWIACSP